MVAITATLAAIVVANANILPAVCPLAVAFALLSAPPDTPEAAPSADQFPAYQHAIHTAALSLEIMDPRESRYILSRVEDWQVDIDTLRRRHEDLRNAPAMAMSDVLPPRLLVNEMLQFNRAYRRGLDSRLDVELDRQEDIRQVIREVDQLYAVWDAVRDARCEFYYVTVRRQALKKLTQLLGDQEITCLPPVVPDWRFVEIK